MPACQQQQQFVSTTRPADVVSLCDATCSPHPASSLLLVEASTTFGNIRCCLCINIRSKNQTILRAECFHRFCRICFNTEDTILLLKQEKCPACQNDLDETLSEVLRNPVLTTQSEEAKDVWNDDSSTINSKQQSANTRTQEAVMNRSNTGIDERKRRSQAGASDKNKKSARDEREEAYVPNQKTIFENRFAELTAFKAKNGHCDVPKPISSQDEHTALSQWCSNLRRYGKETREGKIPNYILSEDQIGRLEALGFDCSNKSTFDSRFVELIAFKAKHGHCSAPRTSSSEYKSLGQWCNRMRSYYKQIQKGKIPTGALSQDEIEKLESVGFEWNINTTKFEGRCAELIAFKAKHGHCYPPSNGSTEYKSLGLWCGQVRYRYRKIREGKFPDSKLSQDLIRRLEGLGFEWSKNRAFEERFAELAAFKEKHGHCDSPTVPSGEDRLLGEWCNRVRGYYKKMQEGKISQPPLSHDQIGRLETLGFHWSKKSKFSCE